MKRYNKASNDTHLIMLLFDDDVNLSFDCLSCDVVDEWRPLTSQSLKRSTDLAPSRECFVNGLLSLVFLSFQCVADDVRQNYKIGDGR